MVAATDDMSYKKEIGVEQRMEDQLTLIKVFAGTSPISNGFDATNHTFNKIRDVLEAEYYYSNIYKNLYDFEDEELLSWASDLD